jgi:hypothetical protein
MTRTAPLLCLALAACPRGGVDPTATTGTTGDTATTPDTTTSVTSPDQTQACIDYLVCLEAAEAPNLAEAQEAYGADSDCWTDLASAQSCNQLCVDGIEGQSFETPTVTECWTRGVPPTSLLFEAAGITGAAWTVTGATGDAQCAALPGRSVSLVGSTDAEFSFTLLDASVYPPQGSTGQCTLGVDRAFACPNTKPYFGVWTGSFQPAFDALDFVLAFDSAGVTFSCEVQAGPVPKTAR